MTANIEIHPMIASYPMLRFLCIRLPLALSAVCFMIILNLNQVDSMQAEMRRPHDTTQAMPFELVDHTPEISDTDEPAVQFEVQIPAHHLRDADVAAWFEAEEDRAAEKYESADPAIFVQHPTSRPAKVETQLVEIPTGWLFARLESQSNAPYFRQPISPTTATR